ncbi:unnamed protein product [Miscanthus lutarioriparius]|uniref:Uncharacterized protein n=1 Tax=Miscanthus lutarioriparius TaxID=422564 RepID=A0A811SG54_9POAL|nr:unnamed protein product [Miscanthus lutarioriparius]
MQRAVRQRYIVSSGRTSNFSSWDETREAVDAHMEFRAYVRIEGIPLHAWGLEVDEKVLGKECAIHHVEEHTRRKERTRTFDLWTWCSDPCKIPTEVWLTIADPDVEQPPVDIPQAPVHRDPPTNIKHGLTYRILPHVATVEDLSFIRGNGGPGGPPNRKRRRNFDWSYSVPNILGEARERQHEGRGRDNKEGVETRAVKKAPAHADPTCQKEKNKENGLNMMLVKVHNNTTNNTNNANLDQVQPSESTEREAQLRSADIQGSDPMDEFSENITHHLEQPLLPTPSIVFEPEQLDMATDIDYTQRKGSRLADKAKTIVGKDSMKLAQELLSKKLGELTTEQPSSNEANFDIFHSTLSSQSTW